MGNGRTQHGCHFHFCLSFSSSELIAFMSASSMFYDPEASDTRGAKYQLSMPGERHLVVDAVMY